MIARAPLAAGLAAAAFVASGTAVAAQGLASIRGTVYDCANGAPVAGAVVTLRGLDSFGTVQLRADGAGRFQQVGLAQGRWIVAARYPNAPPIPGVFLAERFAVLEGDDWLDVRIGTKTIAVGTMPTPGARSDSPQTVRPICDPPMIRPAPTTADRYIIH